MRLYPLGCAHTLKLFPAIDLKDGQVVRLLQGNMEEATVYAQDPAEVARGFAAAGSRFLHIVDLNGAFAGRPVNDEAIRAIVAEAALRVQAGGGIRTLARIEELLELGVERVILGTVAVKDPDLVREAVQEWGGSRIVVGIDARNGRVAIQGWAEETELAAAELGRKMKDIGVETVVYTDIARDGMLLGPDAEGSASLAEATGLQVVVSGGISSLEDLRKLREAKKQGAALDGVIVGKALYSGAVPLSEALALFREEEESC